MAAGLRFILLVLLASSLAWRAECATMAPLSEQEMAAAQRVESLTIPTPGEFFAALGKFDRPNWGQLMRATVLPNTTSRAQLALVLGSRVADGFIAVEAQDGQQVKNIGKDIINLAKQLGVSQSILSRGNSISDFAENNEWSALKEELEATQNEVKLQMAEQKDRDLISLVTMGAWIRGMQTASDIVLKMYTPEVAKLLRQPAIVEYLIAQMGDLQARTQEDPLVVSVRDGLQKTLGFIHFDPVTVPTLDQVSEISATVTTMIDAFCGAPAPSPTATP